MASFDNINYSLRPNKSIERILAFEGMLQLTQALQLSNQIYIGMGSIWFSDFQIAHRKLGISEMYSFEKNEIGFRRAEFNRPYRTIEVLPDDTSDGLPKLCSDAKLILKPWIVWLDYDSALKEEFLDDIRLLIENSPPNTILLVTFSSTVGAYGKPKHRLDRLKDLFGKIVPDDLGELKLGDELPETLAKLMLEYMVSFADSNARPGRFLPAFRLVYTDSVTMVTVGGLLPKAAAVSTARSMIENRAWPAVINHRIETPHLTILEAAKLQSAMPRPRKLNRRAVRALGFDLSEEQIASYERFYKLYPSFAQVSF